MFDRIKAKVSDQIYVGIAEGVVGDDIVRANIAGRIYNIDRGSPASVLISLEEDLDKNWGKHLSSNSISITHVTGPPSFEQNKDEIDKLIESRGNGTYNDISDTASEIIKALGTDSKYTYFFSQIANKLARIKNGYSIEDSLLDIAGYAKLELDKERKNEC